MSVSTGSIRVHLLTVHICCYCCYMHMCSHKQDFLLALKKVSKSVGKGDLQKYDDWMKEFGSA
jgi:Vps4 C terminal oligomerisation domain